MEADAEKDDLAGTRALSPSPLTSHGVCRSRIHVIGIIGIIPMWSEQCEWDPGLSQISQFSGLGVLKFSLPEHIHDIPL